MSDTVSDDVPKMAKAGKTSIILGLGLALAGAGGGFYAVQAGLVPIGESAPYPATSKKDAPYNFFDAEIAFVPVDPLVISLEDGARHLRIRAQLETEHKDAQDIERLMPRVVDVLNTYLRALEPEDLTRSASLMRLRAQMLRRVQVVVGATRVRDLLIMEFVVN
jgi:flagellar FliL protein